MSIGSRSSAYPSIWTRIFSVLSRGSRENKPLPLRKLEDGQIIGGSVAAAAQTSTITVLPLVTAHKDSLLWVRQEPVTGARSRP